MCLSCGVDFLFQLRGNQLSYGNFSVKDSGFFSFSFPPHGSQVKEALPSQHNFLQVNVCTPLCSSITKHQSSQYKDFQDSSLHWYFFIFCQCSMPKLMKNPSCLPGTVFCLGQFCLNSQLSAWISCTSHCIQGRGRRNTLSMPLALKRRAFHFCGVEI